ncbi:alkaline phosphatase D family protein [Variovorax boronicumulans]|uniref:alkaline phosphatase D family protein n=1 Tax=Variovorax boronicumulans TaxID=436515 RepID=UPI00085BF8EB|nr:alkaline phosphatase D family protein [Variovorax boronicumulans]OEZ29890.1 alkaline phosphatase [Variovorax boronicumulans]
MTTPFFTRRRLLHTGLAAAALGHPFLHLRAQPLAARDPFTLGVASGAPRPDGMVLWMRLAPDPVQGGGMGEASVAVQWEVAEDERFRRIVTKGIASAEADLAHSVHVEVQGLRPGRPYWYRFTAGGVHSPVGRTRTAPADDDAAVQPLRFAFASCQQYEEGYYAAYRDMAAQPLDFVVHLGDYIYESSRGSHNVRRHEGGIPTDLAGFRNRYALYKTDPHLQAAHAAFPWLVTWDDHEVANDYTDDVSPRTPDPAQFLAIRAAAYQAWYEHMPVPASMRPRGAGATIYGRHRFGRMLDVMLLDGRQYRSHHACLPGRSTKPLADCADRLAPERSLLGMQQEAWLANELATPPARWTVIAQPTLLAEADRQRGAGHGYWMDGWDGYAAARTRLLDALTANPSRGGDALVLGGDVHAFWAADLRREPQGPVVATEFVGGAITSEGPSAASVAHMRAKNEHLRYGRADKRGYGLMTLDARGCAVEFRAVDDEKNADSAVAAMARFSVERGAPGVHLEST